MPFGGATREPAKLMAGTCALLFGAGAANGAGVAANAVAVADPIGWERTGSEGAKRREN